MNSSLRRNIYRNVYINALGMISRTSDIYLTVILLIDFERLIADLHSYKTVMLTRFNFKTSGGKVKTE